jgi:thiamine pyrophosphate-dependent acetolactate synthase large subunit-like protein
MYEGSAAGAALEQLRAAGLRTLFHTNTSGFVPFWNAIHAARDVQVVNLTHEGHGVAAAQGYALASKQLGFFFGDGCGICNAMSNIYCAWKDRTPVIATFGGGSLSDKGKDHAETWDDQMRPSEPFAMWTGDLITEEMADVVRRAIRFAFGPPSGPVMLNWGNAQANARVREAIYPIDLAKARHSFRGRPDLIEKAAQWLAEAQNPVIIAGPEIGEDGAEREIIELAEKLSLPVTHPGWPNELNANFPTNHPLYVGRLNAMRLPRRIDLLINLGDKFTAQGGGAPLAGARIIHVSHDPDILGKAHPVDVAIASDLRLALRDISIALDGILTRPRLEAIRSARLAEVTELNRKLRQARDMALRGRFNKTPLSWERVGYELEQALEPDAVIVPEVGTQWDKLLGQLKLGYGNKPKFGRTTGSALGWGMAAAFGVNVALPERQVVAIQGDGGFLFGQSETLWSIARYEAPMLIVLMNNRVYNDSRSRNNHSDDALYREGRDYSGYLGDPNVEYTRIAEAYHLRGEKVRTPDELAPALQRALRSMREGKAVLMDIDIAPDHQPMANPTWYQRHSLAEIRNRARQGGARA